MTQPTGEPLPDFSAQSPRTPGPSAAELQAKYHRIKRRQQLLAVVGFFFLAFLYVFLRHIAPVIWGGAKPRRRFR